MSDDRNAGRRPAQKESKPGLLLGRPFGIPVFVAPSTLGLALLLMIVFLPTVRDTAPDLGTGFVYLVAASFAVLLIGSVLLHELAHSVVAKRFGLPVRRIVLQLLGGVSELEREPETPGREFLVAVVGPLVSLGLGGLGYLAYQAIDPDLDSLVGLVIGAFAWLNAIVGVFNLLPGLPLDGGRVMRALVWRITGRPSTGTIAAAWSGRIVAILVVLLPWILAGVAGRSPDIISVVWAALIASFIWMAASSTIQHQRIKDRLPGLRVRSLTRRAVPVAADLPLSEALRRAHEQGAQGIVVVDSMGTATGLVSEASVSATPEHRRPWVVVSSVARSLEPGLRISAELAGEELVRVMQATPASEYLVVEENGDIYGVLATADIERAFATAR